ncbi:MAG: CBS domain-containing protein, partial [Microcoleaceae cyanobacterium]
MYIPPICQAINYAPFTVTADVPIEDVIIAMSGRQEKCVLVIEPMDSQGNDHDLLSANSGFTIPPLPVDPASADPNYLANHRLLGPVIGILTGRDLIQLMAIAAPLKGFSIAQIMIRSVVMVTLSEIPDIFAVLAIYQKHQIQHLPVIDEQGNLIGLLSPENFLPSLFSTDQSSEKNGHDNRLDQSMVEATGDEFSINQLQANYYSQAVPPQQMNGKVINPAHSNLTNSLHQFDQASLFLPEDSIPIDSIQAGQPPQLIHTPNTSTLRQVTQLMFQHNADYVLITASLPQKSPNQTFLTELAVSNQQKRQTKIVGVVGVQDVV